MAQTLLHPAAPLAALPSLQLRKTVQGAEELGGSNLSLPGFLGALAHRDNK